MKKQNKHDTTSKIEERKKNIINMLHQNKGWIHVGKQENIIAEYNKLFGDTDPTFNPSALSRILNDPRNDSFSFDGTYLILRDNEKIRMDIHSAIYKDDNVKVSLLNTYYIETQYAEEVYAVIKEYFSDQIYNANFVPGGLELTVKHAANSDNNLRYNRLNAIINKYCR